MKEVKMITIRINLADEQQRQAFEILQEAKRTGTIKAFIVNAVLSKQASVDSIEMRWMELKEEIEAMKKEITRICRTAGIPEP